jgi:hypothetical protein
MSLKHQPRLAARKWQIRVPRAEISYLRFLLEGYEGVAGLSTLDSAQGLLEITVPPGRGREWKTLLNDIKRQFLVEVTLDPNLQKDPHKDISK